MSDAVLRFINACKPINTIAGERNYPPFAAGFGSETPLNSAPYVFDLTEFRTTFGSSEHRRHIIDDCETALDRLRQAGVDWRMLLIGGSFLRPGDTPSDIDGLIVYTLDPAIPNAIDAIVAHGVRSAANPQANFPRVDFKFCPADVHPVVLVKRILFFASLFSYDRVTHGLLHGTVILLSDAMEESFERKAAS